MRVVVDPELIGDSQQQRIGLGDGLVRLQLLDQPVRFVGVAAAENGPRSFVDESDLVLAFAAVPEIGAVAIVDEREDAAADGDARLSGVTGLFPGDEALSPRYSERYW